MTETNNQLISIDEFAKSAGYHVESARRMAREGRIPAIKIGKKWYVPRAKLEEFIEDQLSA